MDSENIILLLGLLATVIVLIEVVLYYRSKRPGEESPKVDFTTTFRRAMTVIGFLLFLIVAAGSIAGNYVGAIEKADLVDLTVKLEGHTTLLENAYYRLTMTNKIGSFLSLCADMREQLESYNLPVVSLQSLVFANGRSLSSYDLYQCAALENNIIRIPYLSKAGAMDSAHRPKVFYRSLTSDKDDSWRPMKATISRQLAPENCMSGFDMLNVWVLEIELPKEAKARSFELGVQLDGDGWSRGYPPSLLLNDFSSMTTSMKDYRLTLCLDSAALVCEEVSFDPDIAQSIRHFDKLAQILMHPDQRPAIVKSTLTPGDPPDLSNWSFVESVELKAKLQDHNYCYQVHSTEPGKVSGVAFHHPSLGNWPRLGETKKHVAVTGP